MSQYTTNRLMTDGFSTIQTPSGTYPVAGSPSDVLTLVSSDGSISIVGNAVTDTIDITVVGGPVGNAFGVIQTNSGSYPTADTASDVLTLTTANPADYFFQGNAVTDTVTLNLFNFYNKPQTDEVALVYALMFG